MKQIRQSGFTLIEMAIVLSIIGLILGAVSIGKDAQRNAEYMKIKQKFIDQWAQAYNLYYQKTGVVLGDSQVDPRFMVGGDTLVFQDGIASGGANPGISSTVTSASGAITGLLGKICHGQGYAQNSVGTNDRPLASATGQGADAVSMDLFDLMDRVGIRMPPGRAEGREDRYVYLDSNGNPAELQICFQWNPSIAGSGGTSAQASGNVMVIRGLTPDLARALDQMIDGKPDAREGRFRMQGINNASGSSNVGTAGLEWDVSNTQAFGATIGTGGTQGAIDVAGNDPSRLDEDQVVLVTAHYTMNQ